VVGGLYGIGLQGGIMRPDFVAMQGELEAAHDAVTDAGVDRSLARAQLDVLIEKLQGKVVEFNKRLRADFAGTPYERVMVPVFPIGAAEAAVRETLRHVGRLWEKINQISPAPAGVAMPLVLLGGYSRANFDLDRTALRMDYRALGDAEVDLKVAREERNDVQDRIYEVLKAYRLKIPTVLPEGHALLDALPVLTPPTGHTPSPVAVQGVWDAGAQKAKITWAASPEADVREYEVRGVPGDDYQAEDEEVLATFAPEDAREFLTDFALGAPEVTAGFKVYVVLESGNERGE